MKTVLDLAPLAVFFVAWLVGGIYVATAALIAACVVQCAALKALTGKVERANLVVCGLTIVLGGAALAFRDDMFIRVKPTVVYAVFAAALLVADFGFGRNLIKAVAGKALPAPDSTWRKCSCAWAVFFVALAAFNWIAAQTFSEAAWVKTKTFGYPAATLIFALAQFMIVGLRSQGGDLSRSEVAPPTGTIHSRLKSSSRRSSVGTHDSDAPASANESFPAKAGTHSPVGMQMDSRFRGKGIEPAAGAAESSVPPLERRDEGKDLTLKNLIARKLSALNPLELEVRDESAAHRGHAEAHAGAHFRVRVVSERFSGLSRLQRHRLVYETVGPPAAIGLHALAVRAVAPEEIGFRVPRSPKGDSPQ